MLPILSPRTAISAIFFVHGTVTGTIAVQLPVLKERLAISDGEIGRLLLALTLGAICAMPFAGHITRAIGNVATIRVAAVALLATGAGLAAGLAYWPLLALFFCIGLGNGLTDVAMNGEGVVIERWLAKPIMSSLHGFWSVGGFASAGVAWLMVDRSGPVIYQLAVIAAGALLMLAATISLKNEPVPPGEGGGFSLPTRATLGIGLLTMVSMICEGALLDWGGIYLRDVIRVSPGAAATALFAFSGGMSVGRFAGDRVRAAISAVQLTRAGGLVTVLALGIIVTAHGPLQAGVGFFIGGLAIANLVPVMFSAAGKVKGLRPEVAVAGIATVGYAGFLVGPVIIGQLSDVFGMVAALATITLAGLTVALFAGVTRSADES